MKTAVLATLVLASSAAAASNPTALTFEHAPTLPPLSLSELVRKPGRPLQFAAPTSPALARPPLPTAASKRPSSLPPTARMPVVEPAPDVDYKIATVTPDPNTDFKMQVLRPAAPTDPANPDQPTNKK